ncbi:hypothetical protein NHX12_026452 [Muraenolepis orangiensis]|uniref:Uncharacterized protein n=1 Tax=Muraenolepis orangiensis TaxID=630683 RepID=A0A9Q0EHI6_9TELE|nr:hypothetical protein NHX12_026452 [Muraenolepis orangiensis]
MEVGPALLQLDDGAAHRLHGASEGWSRLAAALPCLTEQQLGFLGEEANQDKANDQEDQWLCSNSLLPAVLPATVKRPIRTRPTTRRTNGCAPTPYFLLFYQRQQATFEPNVRENQPGCPVLPWVLRDTAVFRDSEEMEVGPALLQLDDGAAHRLHGASEGWSRLETSTQRHDLSEEANQDKANDQEDQWLCSNSLLPAVLPATGTRTTHEGTPTTHDGTRTTHEGTRTIHEGTRTTHEGTRTTHEGTRTTHEATFEPNVRENQPGCPVLPWVLRDTAVFRDSEEMEVGPALLQLDDGAAHRLHGASEGWSRLVSSLHTSLVRRMVDLLILMVPDQDPQDLSLTEVRGLDHLERDARALDMISVKRPIRTRPTTRRTNGCAPTPYFHLFYQRQVGGRFTFRKAAQRWIIWDPAD